MNKYSSFGLDDNKKSHDSGSKGNKYCPWCQSDKHNLGMSICFVNWIICHQCAEEGLKAFRMPLGTSERIQEDQCFKKNSKQSELCYMSLGDGFKVAISKEYLEIAVKLLRNKKAIDSNGQFKINFSPID